MKRLIAIIALMALALPVSAQEDDALVMEIGTNWADGRTIESRTGPFEVIRSGIVGHFLWLEWGDPDRQADTDSPTLVSYDISDPAIEKVIAHLDGTVEIIRETHKADGDPDESETSNVVEEFPTVDWSLLRPFGAYLK